jgi:hypothetical protein
MAPTDHKRADYRREPSRVELRASFDVAHGASVVLDAATTLGLPQRRPASRSSRAVMSGRALVVRYLFSAAGRRACGTTASPGSLSVGGSRAQNVDVSALHDPPDLRSSTSRCCCLAAREAVDAQGVCEQPLARALPTVISAMAAAIDVVSGA